jgi:hypothetical protein
MATLVLSTVGNALGGPVGGAIGALIGQSIDQQLLGPATRGPRLGDLKVQSSSYGTQIPRVYGSMRVAGTVIWATDLVESSQMSGAKGQLDSVLSYSVSLAVALSSRAVKSVGRIWADGKLLRGAEGDFKVATKFRFYAGDEDQDIDPFIASVEGLANTPAYRRFALAVFEDLQLGDYGNRIPFLTFEVFADDAVTLGQILSGASDGIISSTESQTLIGYAAYGQSIKAAVQPLLDSFAVELFDDGSRLVTPASIAIAVGDDELGSSSDDQQVARIQREQIPARSLPSVLRVGFYDPALDYQSGEARAVAADKRGSEEQRELPAVVSAADAKSLAQSMIAREWAERDKLTLCLPPKYLGLSPGARLDVDLSPRVWRVEQCTIDGFVNVVELRPWTTAGTAIAAESGRIVPNTDVVEGDAVLALFDIPDVLQLGSTGPVLMLAASRASPGWKSRNAEIAAGAQVLQAQTARRKTVLGAATSVLGLGDPYLINAEGSLDVQLVDPEQWLTSCDDEALIDGSNLAVLGSEVLQFCNVEPLGQGKFRLTRMLRGRAGTEWAMNDHAIGEPFALIERGTLTSVAIPPWVTGANVSATIHNLSGDLSTSPASVFGGESGRPLSPVALKASIDAAGDLAITWTRRSRSDFAWVDGIDAPIGESSEQYRVNIAGPQSSFEFSTTEAALQVHAAELASLGSGEVTIKVCQVGDGGASHPAEISLTI